MVSSRINLGSRAKVRTDVISIFRAPQRRVLQSQFEIRNLPGLAIADQPVVGVSAIVSFLDDPHVIVDALRHTADALRERMNSGLPFGSQPSNCVIVVSVIMIPAAFTPKSSSLVITPGKPSMRMRWPCLRHNVEDRSPSARRPGSQSSYCARSQSDDLWCSFRWQ